MSREILGRAFVAYCREKTAMFVLEEFDEYLRKQGIAASVSLIYRLEAGDEVYYSIHLRSSTSYWWVSWKGGNYLLPRPLSADQFSESRDFKIGPNNPLPLPPAAMGECDPAMLAPVGDHWKVESVGRLESGPPPPPIQLNADMGLPDPGPQPAMGPASSSPEQAGAGQQQDEPPTSGVSLGRADYLGLMFTLMCRCSPSFANPEELRSLLARSFPEVDIAEVYRERRSKTDIFKDQATTTSVQYWRFSFGERHFLLPCPNKRKAFRGVRGFEIYPPEETATVASLEFCRPARIENLGEVWECVEEGILGTEWVSGWPQWQEFEHLLNSPPVSEASASEVAESEENGPAVEPQESATSSPPDEVLLASKGVAQPEEPVTVETWAVPIEKPPLEAILGQCYLGFCHSKEATAGDPCFHFKRLIHELDLDIRRLDLKMSQHNQPVYLELPECRGEKFWLVTQRAQWGEKPVSGWLFPCTDAYEFNWPLQGFTCLGQFNASNQIQSFLPAKVGKAGVTGTWVLESMGAISGM